jgi:succinoglycan biosynthesis protein ExoU
MTQFAPGICVIIPAWNASATIGRAIASALVQPDVAEVLVVDDASTDGTADRAGAADDGSGRLCIVRQPQNRGPAAARNAAIAASRSPFLALLDSDDFLLPGRFTRLLATPGWDAIADNLAFVADARVADLAPAAIRRRDAPPGRLSLAGFVEGNISIAGRPRAELGFIKPVLRRDFLVANDLRYDETLRLGEDYALYARILARGGVFMTIADCGYVAVERANSLSGSHRTADLAALALSDADLLTEPGLEPAARAAIRRHHAHVIAKARHRGFLDTRRALGLGPALRQLLVRPDQVPGLALGIARDKWNAHVRRPAPATEVRYLFA